MRGMAIAEMRKDDALLAEHLFLCDRSQPEKNIRKAGVLNLATRIRRILEGDEKLPEKIAETIKHSVGEGQKPTGAVVIVGPLQALQGDKQWADQCCPRCGDFATSRCAPAGPY